MTKHNVFVNDKVHVRRRQCETCIFGKNSPINTERRDEMVAKCGDEGVIPCHKHIHQDAPIEPVCHGFYALKGNMTLRLADALDYIEWWDD
jgi:hypothetical protein